MGGAVCQFKCSEPVFSQKVVKETLRLSSVLVVNNSWVMLAHATSLISMWISKTSREFFLKPWEKVASVINQLKKSDGQLLLGFLKTTFKSSRHGVVSKKSSNEVQAFFSSSLTLIASNHARIHVRAAINKVGWRSRTKNCQRWNKISAFFVLVSFFLQKTFSYTLHRFVSWDRAQRGYNRPGFSP